MMMLCIRIWFVLICIYNNHKITSFNTEHLTLMKKIKRLGFSLFKIIAICSSQRFRVIKTLQVSPLVTTMLVRTNLDVTTKFWGSKKDQMRVCYSKMHGCNDIPLVRTIFSRDERSRYKRASLYSFWTGYHLSLNNLATFTEREGL